MIRFNEPFGLPSTRIGFITQDEMFPKYRSSIALTPHYNSKPDFLSREIPSHRLYEFNRKVEPSIIPLTFKPSNPAPVINNYSIEIPINPIVLNIIKSEPVVTKKETCYINYSQKLLEIMNNKVEYKETNFKLLKTLETILKP